MTEVQGITWAPGYDGANATDTLQEYFDWLNAERVGAGQPPYKTLVLTGSDVPYEELGV